MLGNTKLQQQQQQHSQLGVQGHPVAEAPQQQ
jgi:hypothetical protein